MDFKKTVWLLDEEKEFLDVINKPVSLRYNTKSFNSFEELKTKLNESTPDLIIFYIGGETHNTLNYIADNSIKNSQIPFLVVSEIDDLDIIKYVFANGGVDYQLFPINLNLFLSKLSFYLSNSVKFVARELNYLENQLDKLELTIKESKILKMLLEAPKNKMHRNELSTKIWGNVIVHQKTLDVHLYNLRKKLAGTDFIISSEGSGMFSAQIRSSKEVNLGT